MKKSLSKYLEELQAEGRYTFSLDECLKEVKKTRVAALASIRRLKEKNTVASPVQGFYLIIPPEYRRLGSLPAEQFINELMDYLRLPYYIGLLSAAEFHGAAHHRPQEFQVVTQKNRPHISCGKVNIKFIANKNISQVQVEKIKTPRGYANVSTPEATAIDLVLYQRHAGGLGNVAGVLKELQEKIDSRKLGEYVYKSPKIATVQQLGYLLDRIIKSKLSDVLEGFIKKKAKAYIPLLAPEPIRGARKDDRWKILVNTDIEVD